MTKWKGAVINEKLSIFSKFEFDHQFSLFLHASWLIKKQKVFVQIVTLVYGKMYLSFLFCVEVLIFLCPSFSIHLRLFHLQQRYSTMLLFYMPIKDKRFEIRNGRFI